MSVSVKEIGPGFVGEVGGVRIYEPVEAATVEAIREAIDHFGVLVFHDQPLDDTKQVAFSRNFGALEQSQNFNREDSEALPEVSDLSNADVAGNVLPVSAGRIVKNLGNEWWHSDSSFKPIAAKYSLLSGRKVPPQGGETEFADARAGFESWPGWQGLGPADLEGLVCEHSIVYSRMRNSGNVFTAEEKAERPTVRQHLVRTIPTTGRKSVLVGAHAAAIVGWPEQKSRGLIDDLNAWLTRERFVYRHVWREHDLVMWDNRAVLHRGRPFDRERYPRVMHRTTVKGDGPVLPMD